MQRILKKFINHLDDEYNFLVGYLQTLENQAKCVVASDISQINKNIEDVVRYAHANRNIEHDRFQVFQEVGEFFNLSGTAITITNVISKVDSEWADKLTHCKQKLFDIAKRIQRQIETNKFVIQYASNFTHDMIKLTDRALRKDNVYSKKGTKEDRTDQLKLMDQKA